MLKVRLKKILARPAGILMLTALGSGAVHSAVNFVFKRDESLFYGIFFFALAAALTLVAYQAFLRRRRNADR